MKILVTGGAGFIGSNLANRLAESSENEIIALDDLSLGVTSNLSDRVCFVRGSVKDPQLMLDLTRGCDYVFHDAAKSSSPMFKDAPSHGVDVNAIGFMTVMEASRRSGVKKVIFASSSSLYNGMPMPFKETQVASPKSFYEASFFCREVLARSYYLEWGLESIGLRYFSVYGRNERHKGKFANNITQFLWDISAGTRPVIFGDGSQTRDFTYVDDIVSANILAMESEVQFGIYNAGTGVSASFNEIVKLINNRLGTDIDPVYIENPVRNYVQDTLADISLARTDLGFKAKYDLNTGISKLIEHARLGVDTTAALGKGMTVARVAAGTRTQGK